MSATGGIHQRIELPGLRKTRTFVLFSLNDKTPAGYLVDLSTLQGGKLTRKKTGTGQHRKIAKWRVTSVRCHNAPQLFPQDNLAHNRQNGAVPRSLGGALKNEEGINPKREIYLRTKDQREVPITRVGEPILLSRYILRTFTTARLKKFITCVNCC